MNSPVQFTNPPSGEQNNVGDSVSVSAAATGGTITYTETGLPTGLSINSSTGLITGTVNEAGTWQTVITATAGSYSNTAGFEWDVYGPITVTDQGDQVNQIGDVLSTSGSPPTAVVITATDTAAGTLSYSGSGLPTGLSINSSTGAITGTVSDEASTTTP